jgi:hypothetical protein
VTENDIVTDGGNVSFVPEFDLSDKAFQQYLERRDRRNANSQSAQRDKANVGAARIERATTTSFLD